MAAKSMLSLSGFNQLIKQQERETYIYLLM